MTVAIYHLIIYSMHYVSADLDTNDAGYLLKEEELAAFFEHEKRLYIAVRNNMKRLMTEEQHELFKRRSVIEIVWNALKERLHLVYSLARAIHGLFRHYFYCIASYLLKPLFGTINWGLLEEKEMVLA